MKAVKLIWRGMDAVFEAFTLLCLVSGLLVVLYQVFAREFLESTPSWSEETARILLVWIGFLCAAVGFREQAHIAITLVVDRFPPVLQRGVGLAVQALILLFGLYLVVQGAQFTADTRFATLPGTGLPRSVLYVMMPVAGVIICAATALQLLGVPTQRYAGSTDPDALEHE